MVEKENTIDTIIDEEAVMLETIPMLPLRGVVVYPHMVMHLDVGRDKSLKSVDLAMDEDRRIFLSSQIDPQQSDPLMEDIYEIGVIAEVKQLLRLPGTTVRILVEGITRAKMHRFLDKDDTYQAEVEYIYDQHTDDDDLELEALMRTAIWDFKDYAVISNKISNDTIAVVENLNDSAALGDIIASHLSIALEDRQSILEAIDIKERLEVICQILVREKQVAELERKIAEKVKEQIDQSQKEYYLKEQIKAIQNELDDKDDKESENEELLDRLESAGMSEEAYEKVKKEIERLYRTPSAVAEVSVMRNYIDWMLDIPWKEKSRDRLDLNKAQKILDEDHYGLEKPKERILEYLAVRKMKKDMKGPIICLVGPPGTGKTSLAKSVARALNRKFVRLSLGGVHDEAEIRGHRKTYIGAMPGRIIQSMKKAGTVNPVILLDEVDKLGSDYKGDPSSALLEVLDPEQNNSFSDNYIEVPYDLSKVLFITTANVAHTIPRPLLDRMETIEVNSYTQLEKLEIAKRHLVTKQLKENGLEKRDIQMLDDGIAKIINQYTREAGVRSLERSIGTIFRKSAKLFLLGEKKIVVDESKVEELLGVPPYRKDEMAKESEKGLVMGLAVTSVGGTILPVEASVMKGTGKLQLTGSLGDVMKESASAGLTYLRSNSEKYKLPENLNKEKDIHIHYPEGAIPKDGPSAGVTMVTALSSIFLDRKVKKDVAMTGEVTIRGRVLAIGGLKEKILAAHRAGIKTVIIPKENEKNIEDIPKEVQEDLNIVLAETVEDVLAVALEK
jgi:ATP-dependent Lon protease